VNRTTHERLASSPAFFWPLVRRPAFGQSYGDLLGGRPGMPHAGTVGFVGHSW
jgi:hypothetical protein